MEAVLSLAREGRCSLPLVVYSNVVSRSIGFVIERQYRQWVARLAARTLRRKKIRFMFNDSVPLKTKQTAGARGTWPAMGLERASASRTARDSD